MIKAQNWVASISGFAMMTVCGAQAAQFLQGQMTCDLRHLQSGQAILGACCDHKGRMLANGWVGRWAEDFIVLLPENMLAMTIAHLQKFAVFSKVTLSAKTDWAVLNYAGGVLPTLPWIPFIHSQLPIIGYENYHLHGFMGPQESIASLQKILSAQATIVEERERALLTLLTHLVFVQPATQGLFIPQMIGLEKLGGVSFDKGCYVGQEVIARTQHLGQLKRHLHMARIVDGEAPQVGDSLYDEREDVVGCIAAIVPDLHSGYRLLAVIQDHALTGIIYAPQQRALVILD